MSNELEKSFSSLIKTLHALRGPNGCPWDKAQTHQSLIKCLREESQEVISAIEKQDDENLKEELGDLLLQALFHALIAQEEKRFTVQEVIDGLNKKLITRHPHVFGSAKANTPEEALTQWKAAKLKEKENKNR